MQIPILNGIFADESGDFRTSYPVNMVPVPKATGISAGYLRPADGIIAFGAGPGIDRGGINWRGICYRVMGIKLVKVEANGKVTVLGEVGGAGQCSFDYSFDRLAITSSLKLFYYDGLNLIKVVDPDLGPVLSVMWIDGYFACTDGSYIVVTELSDPMQVSPLKYGSSEVDPDPIVALRKTHNELVAVNRYSIEFFQNAGGSLFPFQRISGANISKGCIGTHAVCVMQDSLVFIGSGRNEGLAVYAGGNATALKISTREIDQLLLNYSEAELSLVLLEARVQKGHQHLYMHLPDRTLVYDVEASKILQEPVWFALTSSLIGFAKYRARNFVYVYDAWICGDTLQAQCGKLTVEVSSHYGTDVRWEFGTMVVYNGSRSAVVHELELVCLTGHVALGKDPTVSTSYSLDGETWSQAVSIRAGKLGERLNRLVWLQQGLLGMWRIQRFTGDSQTFLSCARLEAQLEALSV
jgi:hypothetical protein